MALKKLLAIFIFILFSKSINKKMKTNSVHKYFLETVIIHMSFSFGKGDRDLTL